MCNTRKFLSPKCGCPIWVPFKCVSCNFIPHMCPICAPCTCVPYLWVLHKNHHGVTKAQEIFTILLRTELLFRDKDMSWPTIRVNCYGDDHVTHLERADEGWHTQRHYLVVQLVRSRRSEDWARSRSDGARYFTALAGARGEVRWGQARVRHPLRDNSPLSFFIPSFHFPACKLDVTQRRAST